MLASIYHTYGSVMGMWSSSQWNAKVVILWFSERDGIRPLHRPGAARRRVAAATAAAVTVAVEGGERLEMFATGHLTGRPGRQGLSEPGTLLWGLLNSLDSFRNCCDSVTLARCMGDVVVLRVSLMFKTPPVHFDVQIIFSWNPVEEMATDWSVLDFPWFSLYIPSCNIAIPKSSFWSSENHWTELGHVHHVQSFSLIYQFISCPNVWGVCCTEKKLSHIFNGLPSSSQTWQWKIPESKFPLKLPLRSRIYRCHVFFTQG